MLREKIVETISNITINVLSDCLYEGKPKGMEIFKLKKLKKEISEWIEDFCKKKDGSVLTSSEFQNYIFYQKPISKIFNYINNPNDQRTLESEFLNTLINDCKDSVVSSGGSFTVDDDLILREFFVKILDKYKDFFSENLDMAGKYNIYATKQIVKSESGVFVNEIQKVEDMTKNILDILNQKEEIDDVTKNKIYSSLCNILWHGNIEEVCDILPLIESKSQELDIAIKMNLVMISDCQFEKKYSMDTLKDIRSVFIKNDIIRKIILLNMENANVLENLLLITEDTFLKQIIGDIKKKDFSNFFTQEVESLHGTEVKSIRKNEYYTTESWLVERIMFIYLYKQNSYGLYNLMKELIKENRNVLEELLIWKKQESEYLHDYLLDENIDNLKKLCAEMKDKCSRYLRIKLEYKKLFYFVLIRSAVIIDDIDVDDIIENLPDSIKENIDIKELIYLLHIKRGTAIQQEILRFCQMTGRYMLLHDFLLQWTNSPQKIVFFFEDHKYLLSEQLILFLLYVRMLRIVKNSDYSKKIYMDYQEKYGNYLEFLLEIFQDSNEKTILETIVTKRKDGSLVYLNSQSEDVLIEIFIKNGMYDDAMEIIRKYEILKKMTPRKLRMKAAILLEKENVLEALNIFLSIFDVYRDDSYVINNILNLSLQNKRVVSEDIMAYAQKSDNINTLTLVAMLYERESKLELSRKYMMMALLRSDKRNINVYSKYWELSIGQNDDTILELKKVDRDTTVFLQELDTENTIIYCIYGEEVLPKEPFEWEFAIHIYREYAIKLGLFRKKVGEIVIILTSLLFFISTR